MENPAPSLQVQSSPSGSDRALKILFVLLVIAVLVIGWQNYVVDYDWDPCEYIRAVRDGQWFVDLGYGRVGYLFLLRPARWAATLFPGGATFNAVYSVQKLFHLGFSLLLIGFWVGLASNLFDRRTALLGSPLLLLNIPFLTHTTRIWTEIPMLMGVYGALWIWAVFVWKETDRRRRVTGYAIIGAILAVCLTVRETALFFLPAFIVPLLATRGRRREGLLAAAGLLAVAGLVFLFFLLLQHLAPTYNRSVSNIETLFPTSFAPSAIVERSGQVAEVLLDQYFLVSALCLISLVYLALRREWGMALLLVCVSYLPVAWVVARGGTLYARYVLPAAPGLALGCLPLFARLEVRGLRRRAIALSAVLLAGLLCTAHWSEVRILRERGRMTKQYVSRWVDRANQATGPTFWLVGSFTDILASRFSDTHEKSNNSIFWPLWSEQYRQLISNIEYDLKKGYTVYVCLDRKAYFHGQWDSIETVKRDFQLNPVDGGTRLFRLGIRPLPASAVELNFSSVTDWGFLKTGFAKAERWPNGVTAVWAVRKEAVLLFSPERLPKMDKEDKTIEVRLRWYCLELPGNPSVDGTLDVEFGGYSKSLLFHFPPGENSLSFLVPRPADPDASLRLDFHFSSLWVPAETLPGSKDKRALAAALYGVALIPFPEQSP